MSGSGLEPDLRPGSAMLDAIGPLPGAPPQSEPTRVTFRNGAARALAAQLAESAGSAGAAAPRAATAAKDPLANALAALEQAGMGEDVSGGWGPVLRLGAPAPGGLTLPAAHPTRAHMYAPRGAFLGEDILVVADTGNHRVMIWFGTPTSDEQPCDVLLGQPEATAEGPAAGGADIARGMYLPTGVLIHEGKLLIADAWHHRILIYNEVPRQDFARPDRVLGQPDLQSVDPNRGQDTCSAESMYWPFGMAMHEGGFYVADTGNRRVLGWPDGIPEDDAPPTVILGQPDATSREENRGAAAAADSFRWPHDLASVPVAGLGAGAGSEAALLVADAGNHRVLGWAPVPPADAAAQSRADLVVGQSDFVSASEWPYGPQRGEVLRFPYAIDVDAGRMAIADTANNRVLFWDSTPADVTANPGAWPHPDAVLGQPSFAANGENGWTDVTPASMCWPYGLSLRGDQMAIVDSGNNRVMLWQRTPQS